MKFIKKVSLFCCLGMMTTLLAACNVMSDGNTLKASEDTKTEITEVPSETPVSSQQADMAEKTADGDSKDSRKIGDQSFGVTIDPIGSVEFTSYAPDLSISQYADVTFELEDSDKVVKKLEGMDTSDIREDIIFKKVEAVSFKDFNGDGYGDIITICSYIKEQKPLSEARIYSGNSNGEFTLERELSKVANDALSELTIQSILDFLGTDRENTESSWKQAYIDTIKMDEESSPYEGYALIYVDDDEIPELVKIGTCEAMGCVIVNYSNGKAHETQLSRLSFTYIPKENLLCNSEGLMDYYYDIIYTIIDGQMTQIAAGYYGAEDNTDIKFDKNGEPIYQYKWNDKIVDKEEYEKQLNQAYDKERSLDGYYSGEYFNADEMIEKITKL